ncbi:MAG: hypothetical protein U0N08_03575 [Oscillospiraceae bacterium]|nr:hypothetical protein [Oscillospiraceae bacterium]
MLHHSTFKRYFLTLLLVVLFVALFSGCASQEEHTALHPNIAMPGNDVELELSLPETLNLPTTTSGIVYRSVVDLDASLTRAARLLGVDAAELKEMNPMTDAFGMKAYPCLDGQLDVEIETGYITYISNTEPKAVDSMEFPSDEQVETWARNAIQTGILDHADDVIIKVTETTGWDGERSGVQTKDVYIYPNVDGYAVFGVYRIVLAYDYSGKIVRLVMCCNPLVAETEATLKTPQELQSALSERAYSASADTNLENCEITSAALAYYMDSGPNEHGDFCMYPVYVLLGEGTDAADDVQTFDVIVDAIQ